MKIKLGKKYRDKVTGFTGTATAKHEWLTGCDTVSLQPPVGSDGKIPGVEGFDVTRLESVDEKETIGIKTDKDRGGPQDNPSQNDHR